MAIYFAMAILPVCLNVFMRKKQNIISAIVCFAVFLLIALRSSSLSADTRAYQITYNYLGRSDVSILDYFREYATEPLYIVYLKTCNIISHGDYRFFIVSSAFIFCFCLLKTISSISNKQWLSWFLFITFGYLALGMNLVRSSMALAIGMLPMKYWIDNSIERRTLKIRTLICYGSALLIHYTSVVYLFIIPLFKFREKHKGKYQLVYIILCVVSLFAGNRIAQLIADVVFPNKVYSFSSSGGWGFLLIVLAIRLMNEFFVNKTERNKKYEITNYLLEIALLFQIMALNFNLWARETTYVFVPCIILLADVFDKYRISRSSKSVFCILLVIVMLLYFGIYFGNTGAEIVPYISMFSD